MATDPSVRLPIHVEGIDSYAVERTAAALPLSVTTINSMLALETLILLLSIDDRLSRI